MESNSNCSRASLKRFRGPSTELSISKAKRPKTQRALETAATSVANSKDKPQLNFKEILKATKEREKVAKEHFNASTNFNISNGTQIKCSNSKSHLASPGEEPGWTKQRSKKPSKNENSTSKPPQKSDYAKIDPPRLLETTGKDKQVNSSPTPLAGNLDKCPESKIVIEEVSKRCSSKSSLSETHRTKTKPGIEGITNMSGIIISNSKTSFENFLFGTHQQSSRAKLFGAADKTNRKYLINPGSKWEINASSVSSVSTTPTHLQSNVSMSMATSESDMNLVSVSSVSSPTSSINQLQSKSYNTTVFFKQPGAKGAVQKDRLKGAYNQSSTRSLGTVSDCLDKARNTSGGRKGRYTNACGEVINLSKHQINMRLRQVNIGKETWGYQNYIRTVPKCLRRGWHPVTPDPMERISKRRFNGKVNAWRRKLHFWDAPTCGRFPPDGDKSIVPAAVATLEVESKQNRIKYVAEENSKNVDEIKQDQAFHGS